VKYLTKVKLNTLQSIFKLVLIIILNFCFINLVFSPKADAIVNNSAGIPASMQSYSNSNGSVWNNYVCMNPSDSLLYPYAFHTWWSFDGDSSNELPVQVDVPAGVDSVTLQLNIIGNHCGVNMNGTGPGPTGYGYEPLPSSTLKGTSDGVPVDQIAQWTRFHVFNPFINIPGLTAGITGTIMDLDWGATYVFDPSDGRPNANSLYYVPVASLDVVISGFNSKTPDDYWSSVFVDGRAVTRFGDYNQLPSDHRCVTSPRPQSIDGLNGSNCPTQGHQKTVNFKVLPPPNQAPSGAFDIVCSATGNGVLTINAFNVNDDKPGNLSITANINNGANPGSLSGSGRGNFTIGTSQGIPDGTTLYTVTGRVTDSEGGAADMASDSTTCPRPAITANCTLAFSTPFAEPSDTFTMTLTINNTSSQYAPPLTYAEHPVVRAVAPPAGLSGLDAAYNYGTLVNPPSGGISNSRIFNDTDIFSASTGTYTITISMPSLPGFTGCSGAIRVGTKPYLKAFGGDIWSGGSFGSCTALPGRGGVYGFAKTDGAGQYVGGSAQFTVTALLNVNEFFTASNRSSNSGNTRTPKGLTFANSGAGVPSSTYGGGFGTATCVTDYFNNTRDTTLGSGVFPAGLIPADLGRRQYVMPGNLNINSNRTIPLGTQVAVFVDGDVYINGNITYASPADSYERMPYFVIVARGNIYIDNNVSRIDGLLIAQPDNPAAPTNGIIYTCAQGLNQPYGVHSSNALDIYINCQTQLSINGGLIADQIKFLRFRSTLRNALYGEAPNFGNGSGTQAAEVINYTPEMYLAPSPLRTPSEIPGAEAPGPSSSDVYNAIKSLAPIY
jgi:hypothetical protein